MSQSLTPDEQIDHLRALFARVAPPHHPKGVRKFFHDLAGRCARTPRKVVMERIQDANPKRS